MVQERIFVYFYASFFGILLLFEVWVNVGDITLISLRDFQDEKGTTEKTFFGFHFFFNFGRKDSKNL